MAIWNYEQDHCMVCSRDFGGCVPPPAAVGPLTEHECIRRLWCTDSGAVVRYSDETRTLVYAWMDRAEHGTIPLAAHAADVSADTLVYAAHGSDNTSIRVGGFRFGGGSVERLAEVPAPVPDNALPKRAGVVSSFGSFFVGVTDDTAMRATTFGVSDGALVATDSRDHRRPRYVCGRGQYLDVARGCTVCPPGTVTREPWHWLCAVAPGFYWALRDEETGEPALCPADSYCAGGYELAWDCPGGTHSEPGAWSVSQCG